MDSQDCQKEQRHKSIILRINLRAHPILRQYVCDTKYLPSPKEKIAPPLMIQLDVPRPTDMANLQRL